MIFPKPQFEEYLEGIYTLKEYYGELTLVELYEKYKNGNEDLKLERVLDFSEDEYNLTINENGIVVNFSCDSGVFRAISSLKQLIHTYGKELPFAKICDKPDFKKRSYMLDISRCRIPMVKTIERLVDMLADLKYNEFQLYMENFCYKFPHFPQFTENFDCLTPEDMMHLDKYCKERFIDLVPNQNCFGHMATWLATDELSYLEVGDENTKTGTLNILHPDAIKVVEKIFDSVLPYFSSEYVNIGLDEAHGHGKFQLEEICKEKGAAVVFMDYLNQVADLIKRKYGKKVMFWADMVYDAKEEFKMIPKGAYALNWGYDERKTVMMERRCMGLKEREIPYYICPGTATWVSMTGRYDVMWLNVQSCAEMGRRHGAEGFMMTDWGCLEGMMQNPVQSFPAMALAAQYAWNVGEEQGGWNFKFDYKEAAHKYIDEYVFGGVEVCEHIYRLQQYYLLEPSRAHCATLCGKYIRFPLSQDNLLGIREGNGDFYFKNVINYVNEEIKNIEAIEFDENYKRQLISNAKMVVFSAYLCLVRMNYALGKEKIEYLINLADEIIKEHTTLWMRENFEEGINFFLDQVRDRKAELLGM